MYRPKMHCTANSPQMVSTSPNDTPLSVIIYDRWSIDRSPLPAGKINSLLTSSCVRRDKKMLSVILCMCMFAEFKERYGSSI
jgi:hypothetical protein